MEEAQRRPPEPVAICRLKRVAADNKTASAIACRRRREEWQARRLHRRWAGVAHRGARSGAAGYDVTVFDGEAKAGGFIRSQIPRFRLPER